MTSRAIPVKRGVLFVAALGTLVSMSACAGSAVGGQEESAGGSEEVKIGLLGALSGDYASIGEDQVQGFELYLDQHDGELGGRAVDIIEADEGATPESAVSAVRRLLLEEQVDAVAGVTSSASAIAVKDLFVEEQVPVLVSTAGANDVTSGEPSPYLWRTALANHQTGASLGEYLAEEADGSVYVLAADYAAGRETADAFKEAFEDAGGKIAGEDYPPYGSTQDYQPYLARAKESGAAAVWAFFAGSEAVTFVKQYDEFGLAGDLKLFGGGSLTDGAVLDAQGKSALGIETALNYSDLLDTPANQEFVDAYEAAYDESPTGYAMQSYDAALLLDLALDQVEGEVTPQAIADAIATVEQVPSPRGEFTLGDDHNPEQAYYLRRVEEAEGGLGNVVVEELGVFGPAQ